MKIQFRVDVRACLYRGKLPPSSIVTVDLAEKAPSSTECQLIADHLADGETADVFRVVYDPVGGLHGIPVPLGGHAWDELVEAEEPTLESLCQALEALASRVQH